LKLLGIFDFNLVWRMVWKMACSKVQKIEVKLHQFRKGWNISKYVF